MGNITFQTPTMRVCGEIKKGRSTNGAEYLVFGIKSDEAKCIYRCTIFDDDRGGYAFKKACQRMSSGKRFLYEGGLYLFSGELSPKIDEMDGAITFIFKVFNFDFAIPEAEFRKLNPDESRKDPPKVTGFGR